MPNTQENDSVIHLTLSCIGRSRSWNMKGLNLRNFRQNRSLICCKMQLVRSLSWHMLNRDIARGKKFKHAMNIGHIAIYYEYLVVCTSYLNLAPYSPMSPSTYYLTIQPWKEQILQPIFSHLIPIPIGLAKSASISSAQWSIFTFEGHKPKIPELHFTRSYDNWVINHQESRHDQNKLE
jgi:hypothetical protein